MNTLASKFIVRNINHNYLFIAAKTIAQLLECSSDFGPINGQYGPHATDLGQLYDVDQLRTICKNSAHPTAKRILEELEENVLFHEIANINEPGIALISVKCGTVATYSCGADDIYRSLIILSKENYRPAAIEILNNQNYTSANLFDLVRGKHGYLRISLGPQSVVAFMHQFPVDKVRAHLTELARASRGSNLADQIVLSPLEFEAQFAALSIDEFDAVAKSVADRADHVVKWINALSAQKALAKYFKE